MNVMHTAPRAGNSSPIPPAKKRSGKVQALVRVEPDGTPFRIVGREVFALKKLKEAGPAGFTAVQCPGVRLADAVFKLRKLGVGIETEHVPHAGAFAGHHARYLLRSEVTILAEEL